MTVAHFWQEITAADLSVFAGVLAAYFLEYRFQPMLAACPGCYDHVWYGPDFVVSFGEVVVPPPPGSHALRETIGIRGLFAQHRYPPRVAVVGGLAGPTLLLVVGGFFVFRHRSGTLNDKSD